METSSADTGSSQTTSDGPTVSARAIPTRCRWPPLNSCGKRSAASGESPTIASSSATRPRTSSRSRTPQVRSPSPKAWPTVMRGFNEP